MKISMPFFLIVAVAGTVALASLPSAQAAPVKCVGKDGKVEYTDGPCKANTVEKEIKAKPVQVLSKEAVTGVAAQPGDAPKDKRPEWLKEANETFDPVAKCKARGGTIDKEIRACKLP